MLIPLTLIFSDRLNSTVVVEKHKVFRLYSLNVLNWLYLLLKRNLLKLFSSSQVQQSTNVGYVCNLINVSISAVVVKTHTWFLSFILYLAVKYISKTNKSDINH